MTHINGVAISNPKSRDKFCEAVEADSIAMGIVNDAMYAACAVENDRLDEE